MTKNLAIFSCCSVFSAVDLRQSLLGETIFLKSANKNMLKVNQKITRKKC